MRNPIWVDGGQVMRRTFVAGLVVVAGAAAAFGAVLIQKSSGPAVSSARPASTSIPAPISTSSPAPTSSSSAPVGAGTQVAQAGPQVAQMAPAPMAAPAASAPRPAAPPCDNPNALGVSRVVEIDTTGGPGFGFEHFK